MLTWLKKLYRNFPVLRELFQLQHSVNRLAGNLVRFEGDARRIAQEAYLQSLYATDRYSEPRRLTSFEHQVYSQNGEDGILAEYFRRIEVRDRRFLEIGVGDGLENNTRFLLTQGWQGIWVEGDPHSVKKIRGRLSSAISDSRLEVVELFVTTDNIASALKATRLTEEFDLMSLDVDRNTYWIWTALSNLKPRVVVVEYNATFPPNVDWKVDYSPDQLWDGTFNFGASLKAYELLGRKFGYLLVGCDISGTNAFFVREDCCEEKFVGPFDSQSFYEPPRYWLARTAGHPRGQA